MKNLRTFSGSIRKVGAAYGLFYQREIAGFFTQEFGAYRHSRKFVQSCLNVMTSQAATATAFIEGVSSKSLLSMEELTLLMLHEEELYHRRLEDKSPHCSAIGMLAKTARTSSAIVGQNWDWSTSYFPWASLNRFAVNRKPTIVSLSYPGLPVCAGLNSAGLALMWTGAGYYPPVLPRTGVPTYALVLEALLQSNVDSALDYLQSVCNAGAFIFILGDREGRLALVEAVPGKMFIERPTLVHRTNIFENPEAVVASRQKLPGPQKCHSLQRRDALLRWSDGKLEQTKIEAVQSALSQPTILVKDKVSHATLMQIIADCKSRTLLYRKWPQILSPWLHIRL